MKKTETYQNLIDTIDPHKEADKAWFLSLLDEGEQWAYEERHMEAVMRMLRIAHLHVHKKKIAEAKAEIEALKKEENTAENYCKIGALLEKIKEEKKALDAYRCYFEEPYFARMLFSKEPLLIPIRIGMPRSLHLSATAFTRSSEPILPGLILILSTPASQAASAMR